MEDSPTVDTSTVVASQEPTTQTADVQPAAEVNTQDATAQTTEVVNQEASVETATTQTTEEKQTEDKSGDIDEGLAKFAKSQGFDPDSLTEGETKALKLAHENQKAFRKSTVATAKAELDGDITKDEIAQFQAEFRQYQAQKQAETFFSQEGRDDSLAPVMTAVLEEKRAEYGDEYASVLSRDMELLYDLAKLKQGTVGAASVDEDAVRREERESINQKITAGASSAHATASASQTGQAPKIDAAWIANVYDPRNKEHVELMQQAGYR